MLLAISVAALGPAPLGAQGRKIGDFANMPEPLAATFIYCGSLIDGAGGLRKNVTIILFRDRV